MTDEEKRVESDLRCCAKNICWACKGSDGSASCWTKTAIAAADLIERLASERDEFSLLASVCENALDEAHKVLGKIACEREALMDDLHGRCDVCAHMSDDPACLSCSRMTETDHWEWRGLRDQNGRGSADTNAPASPLDNYVGEAPVVTIEDKMADRWHE